MTQIEDILKILICPIEGGSLVYIKERNMLFSKAANVYYPINDNIPILTKDAAIKAEDISSTDN